MERQPRALVDVCRTILGRFEVLDVLEWIAPFLEGSQQQQWIALDLLVGLARKADGIFQAAVNAVRQMLSGGEMVRIRAVRAAEELSNIPASRERLVEVAEVLRASRTVAQPMGWEMLPREAVDEAAPVVMHVQFAREAPPRQQPFRLACRPRTVISGIGMGIRKPMASASSESVRLPKLTSAPALLYS
jgi:hypothetical protein